MSIIIALFLRPQSDTARIPREWAEASDWFVIITLATLFFLLGSFAAWAWMIWRRTTKPAPHVRLLMELEDDQERERLAATGHDIPKDSASWERSPDWWKKSDD